MSRCARTEKEREIGVKGKIIRTGGRRGSFESMHHPFLCHLFLIEITWPIDQTATDRPWYRARNKPCDVQAVEKGEREREEGKYTGNRDHRSSRYRSHGWCGRNSESNGRAAGTKREPRTMRREKRVGFRVERREGSISPVDGPRFFLRPSPLLEFRFLIRKLKIRWDFFDSRFRAIISSHQD